MLKHALLAALLFMAGAVAAQTPAHVGQRDTNAQDTEAILQVTKDFRAALIDHDATKLSALLLNPNILFSSPASPARVKKRRESGQPAFDGIDPGGATAFVKFVGESKAPIDEKFYDVQITQDRHLAWVVFDFEFLEAGKVENHGVEVWQMMKTPNDRWKIFSVVWSSRGTPN